MPDHGDYTSSEALALAKKEGRPAMTVAQELVDKLSATERAKYSKIEVAPPGFINFWLKSEVIAEQIKQINADPANWGRGTERKDQKVLVEYTDPNPFKELHIGHLMSNTIGEVLSRLIESQGAAVKRACYQGDVGLHVAKALWAKGDYALGAQKYETDPIAQREIQEINKKIYTRSDEALNKIYDAGRAASLTEFEKVYQKLGTKFDQYFFESESGPIGQQLVEENIGKVFEKSEGAVVFRGEKFGLHTRVFLTKEGLPTYEAKELGLAALKNKTFPNLDQSLVVTGNEINAYFAVVLKAMAQLPPLAPLAQKTIHIGHGMLRLPEGKMSSRAGNVVAAAALISELAAAVGEHNPELDETTREQIAVAALKYQILKQAPGRDIIFDRAQALSLEGDSGPYLQYTTVRAGAVLAKSQVSITNFQNDKPDFGSAGRLVARSLVHFPEVVARAARELAPQLLTAYLTKLAATFNHFYATERIIGTPNESALLTLTAATRHTLTTGLGFLGIAVPERM